MPCHYFGLFLWAIVAILTRNFLVSTSDLIHVIHKQNTNSYFVVNILGGTSRQEP